MIGDVLYGGWEPLARTAVIALLAYPIMLLMVRLSGHRTLSQLNAFDLIVTVALGSTLASVITSSDTSLAQGALAFGLLIAMQFALSWSASRWRKVEGVVNGEPVLLVRAGRLLPEAMRRARISEDEVKAVARSEGLAGLGDAEAVVLETNGKISVVRRHAPPPSALEPVLPPGRTEVA